MLRFPELSGILIKNEECVHRAVLRKIRLANGMLGSRQGRVRHGKDAPSECS